MHFTVNPSNVHDAAVAVPGDKSISHRALMLGSVANGISDISGFLAGEDCLATLTAMKAMGIRIDQTGPTDIVVHGRGLRGLSRPENALDLGNSGTAMRLMAGLLSGQDFDSQLVGDESLSSRPMGRVITPLSAMGADIGSEGGQPPLTVRGSRALTALDYEMPVASAQVKSAVLLATGIS